MDVEGNVFTGSVFGNVGGEDKITGGDFEVFKSDKSINLTVKNNRGKIASNVDGIMMYYKRLPANTEFTLKAKVKMILQKMIKYHLGLWQEMICMSTGQLQIV